MSERVFRDLEGAMPNLTFIKPAKLAEDDFKGEVLRGEYIGTVPNDFDPDKPSYKFKKEDGSFVVVNSCGSLSRLMERAEIGGTYTINYNGQKKITDGKLKGKTVHQFDIPELRTSGGITFIKASTLVEDGFKGEVLRGVFVGEVPNKFNEDKPDFKFMKDDGTFVVVNSCGSIAKQMKSIKKGDYLQIEYLGEKKIDKGQLKGKTIHDFKIRIAD